METTLKINPEITITLPEDKVIVDRSEYEQLKREADYRGLWDVTELKTGITVTRNGLSGTYLLHMNANFEIVL